MVKIRIKGSFFNKFHSVNLHSTKNMLYIPKRNFLDSEEYNSIPTKKVKEKVMLEFSKFQVKFFHEKFLEK